MKALFIAGLSSLILIISCGKRQEVRAKIYERKELANNRLLIRYHYLVNSTSYTDSATVANKVLPNDSINIFIDPENPAKGLPDLKGIRN